MANQHCLIRLDRTWVALSVRVTARSSNRPSRNNRRDPSLRLNELPLCGFLSPTLRPAPPFPASKARRTTNSFAAVSDGSNVLSSPTMGMTLFDIVIVD